jgi:hypothetical protein
MNYVNQDIEWFINRSYNGERVEGFFKDFDRGANDTFTFFLAISYQEG